MTSSERRTVSSRAYVFATWTLIVYFGMMAFIHVLLTAPFYLGVWDTGVGYFLDAEWPAWSIAILDGAAAWLLWVSYRRGASAPWLGLGLSVVASGIMLGRALWFVVVPVLVVVTVSVSLVRVIRFQGS